MNKVIMREVLSEKGIIADDQPWYVGRKFKHPGTGNMVLFHSLPFDEQKKLNQQIKTDKSDKLDELVKKEPSVSQELEDQMNSDDPNIRAEVVKKLDQFGLHKMINDKDPDVRWMVARRIDQAGLHKMINDPDPRVRVSVVMRIDQKGLHKMLNEKSPIIKKRIVRRLNQLHLRKMDEDRDFIKSIIDKHNKYQKKRFNEVN